MFYLFYLGSVPIKLYWVMAGAAFSAGFILFYLEAKDKGLSRKEILSFYLCSSLCAGIGLRLFYLLLVEPKIIFQEPSRIFSFSEVYWNGGVSLYGGVLGGLFFSIWFCRKNKIPFWKLADMITPAIIISITFMRLGCFLNGCCYGRPTLLPWGVTFHNPLVLAPSNIPLHPVQLYEAGGNFILFVYFWRKRRKTRFAGELSLKYAFAYSLLRIFVEFFKHPVFRYKNTPFTVPQLMAVVFLILSFLLFKMLRRKK